MKILSCMRSKTKKLDVWDMALIKWSCIAFGVLLVIIFPVLTTINIWWLIVLVVILMVRPLYRTYFKEEIKI